MLFPAARRSLTGAILSCLLLLLTAGGAFAADAGKVNFVKRTEPSFDAYTTNPAASFKSWMNQKFWRSEVFTPYWDGRNTWYSNTWVYKDSYAVSDTSHVLRDASGNPLYIPWGCGGGSCPQMAGDISDPAYRAQWIADAKRATSGYKGIWIDDVNLDMRVSDANGNSVRPIDRATGQPMTDAAWRGYFADFMAEVRAALPTKEILHNSIWYAAGDQLKGTDPAVAKEIASANFINLERGVNDDGLTGGTGSWSLRAVLGFVDRVHASGAGVIYDAFDDTAKGKEYNLAAYYLTSTGNDGVGLQDASPTSWWSQWDVDLGAACGSRIMWNGLIRRDFQGGSVLVNEPQAATRTVKLDSAMTNSSGQSVTSVTLPARSGAILRGATSCTPGSGIPTATPTPTPDATPAPSTPAPTTTAPAPSTPATTTTPGKSTTPAPTTSSTTTSTTTKPSTTSTKKPPKLKVVITKVIARAKARAKAAKARKADTVAAVLQIDGRVSGTSRGRLSLKIQRKAGQRCVAAGTVVRKVPAGKFSVRASQPVGGHFRVVASLTAAA
jgi:hypothetical protein